MQSQKQSSSNILSFPSFIGDFEGLKINLNDELIKHPEATFYARVRGHPIKDAGIQDGDLLVIDKAQEPIESGKSEQPNGRERGAGEDPTGHRAQGKV